MKKLLAIMVVIALSVNAFSQVAQKSSKAQMNSKSKGNFVKVAGESRVTYQTNKEGQINLIIPDWLKQRIVDNPNKYKLKFYSKIPESYLNKVLSENQKTSQSNNKKIDCTLNIQSGNKSIKKNYGGPLNQPSDVSDLATKEFGPFTFQLNPLIINDTIHIIGLTGEPIPGAEIYVELEPDEEP